MCACELLLALWGKAAICKRVCTLTHSHSHSGHAPPPVHLEVTGQAVQLLQGCVAQEGEPAGGGGGQVVQLLQGGGAQEGEPARGGVGGQRWGQGGGQCRLVMVVDRGRVRQKTGLSRSRGRVSNV